MSTQATEEQKDQMRTQASAISELAADLESTSEVLRQLKALLADRNQMLDGEMAQIQVGERDATAEPLGAPMTLPGECSCLGSFEA